jgi:glutamine cyclotransferase
MTDHETRNSPKADVVRELELAEFGSVHGVTCDDRGNVWFAYGDGGLVCVEPANGRVLKDFPELGATAGTAFDGSHIWQITDERIVKLDRDTGEVVHSIPLPAPREYSGMAWADGVLWVGRFSGKQLVKIDPQTGEVLKTLDVDRLVTGVAWIDGELWHGSWASRDADRAEADLRRIDPDTGAIEATVEVPGVSVSGIGADGEGRLWCGGSSRGGVHAVRKP